MSTITMKTLSAPEAAKISTPWTTADIPSQKGRSAIITGTGGIGLETALELARAGAEVIIAGRNPRKGEDAIARIIDEAPSATVRFEQVDLASLQSIADFGARLRDQRDSLDLLINNAAVMMPPKRQQTQDGLELQFATNYLGHFALTAQLMPLLCEGEKPRVISLSSVAARDGIIDFADLQSEHHHKPMRAYSQSKLACLMFALELQRRSAAGQWGVTSIAAHPGIARTDLLHNAPGRWSAIGTARTLLWFMFQPASQGALPSLYAATSPTAKGGSYYGPASFSETRGAPTTATIPKQALDAEAASRLWEISEHLAGITIPAPREARDVTLEELDDPE
ncbi:SDR family oxidoreductase [Luteolibacter soli]|uniref:SDR family oxidoreductase n=1 Tax=Luteolibacter soli TaxID=3135280 RepID=A0ABU9AVH1_9BACT